MERWFDDLREEWAVDMVTKAVSQTLDQIKNLRPKEEKAKTKQKEENLNDKLNKDNVNFNQ